MTVPDRRRRAAVRVLLRMLATAAITSGLAVLGSRSDVAAVALLAVLAFLAGLLLAGGPSATQVGPPASDSLGAVRQTLYGLGHDHGPSVEAYRVLLDEGERISARS